MLSCNIVGTLHCNVVILLCGNVVVTSFSQRENNILTTLYKVQCTMYLRCVFAGKPLRLARCHGICLQVGGVPLQNLLLFYCMLEKNGQ